MIAERRRAALVVRSSRGVHSRIRGSRQQFAVHHHHHQTVGKFNQSPLGDRIETRLNNACTHTHNVCFVWLGKRPPLTHNGNVLKRELGNYMRASKGHAGGGG